jgi:hypothetical protein
VAPVLPTVFALALSRALAPVAALPQAAAVELVLPLELMVLAEAQLPKAADLSVGWSPFGR